MDFRSHIVMQAGKRGGKPCIRHTRITVYDVLHMLADGLSVADILHDFPELSQADIQACLAYAADRDHSSLILAA